MYYWAGSFIGLGRLSAYNFPGGCLEYFPGRLSALLSTASHCMFFGCISHTSSFLGAISFLCCRI